MSERSTVRWGILSTARINHAVIPPIKALDYTTLYGVASRDARKAEVYAAEHGFKTSYGSYQGLLDDPEVDAVYISLPNGLHFEWIVKALERGKHVLCEKSITTTVDDVREIEQLAEKKGLWVMEGFMYRYHPFFRKILEYAQSDLVGELQNIQISRAARQANPQDIRLQPGLGPGVMGDVGCYCLNFCRAMMGSEPLSWHAHVRYDPQGVDMEALIRLVFAPQKTAQIFCSFTTNGSFATIIGASGCLHIVEPFACGEGPREFLYVPDAGQGPQRVEVVAEKTGHALEIEDFSKAVLERRAPYLSLADSIGNLTILQDVVERGHRL